MRFSAAFFFAAVAVPAYSFTAWSGNSCDGDRGNTVNLDGSCRMFGGRHSFNAEADACVRFYVLSNCSGERFTYYDQGNRCTNVNTGTDITAFRAWPGGQGCAPY